MTGDLLIRNVRPWPSSRETSEVDVLCLDGLISAMASGLSAPDGVPVAEGMGGVLLPAFADAHAHLDTAGPGFADLIASGATLVRSHARVDVDSGLEKLEGVLAAREAHARRANVQVVAFPQCGVLREKGTTDLLDAALRAGADLVGGLDPAGYDRDPVRHLDVVFGLAEKHQRGVDVHLHDTGSLGAFQVELICERVAALDMRGQVTISHCFALSTVDDDRQRELVDLLARHDVAVTTVAPGAREPLPLQKLRWAGVRVGLGQDGVHDHWSPGGDGDMLDRTWRLAYRNGFRRDSEVEMCVDIATRGGASVLGEPGRGITEGAGADLVVVPGDSITAAVMDRAPRTLVVHEGRVVARDGELVP